jgi:hypothetical protein
MGSQAASAERVLHLIDMTAHMSERLFGIGQRQEVIEIDGVVAGPSKML